MNTIRNKRERSEKEKKIISIVVGGVFGLLLSFFLAYLSYNKFKDSLVDATVKEALHFFLLDGFSFGFLFYISFYFFAYIEYKEHFFTMLKYSFKKFGTSLLPRRMKTNSNLPRTYGDYIEELNAKPTPYYRWLLWDSLFLLIFAIIFAIMYAVNPVYVQIA